MGEDISDAIGRKHEYFMAEALAEARQAAELGEVPVGAVVVIDDEIVGKGHNLRETWQDPTAHAEIIALRAAARSVSSWRLEAADLYVTLEPCPMCAGALVLARIKTVIFAAEDPKSGACGTVMNIIQDDRLNHRVESISGVKRDEAQKLLRDFFKRLRRK